MKTIISKEYFICQHCLQTILKEEDVVVICGTISKADYKNDKAGSGHNYLNTLGDDISYHKDCFIRLMLSELDVSQYDL